MPSQRKTTHADAAPAPNGNYSHVVHAGGLLHVCGWMGNVPETGEIIEGGIEAQTVSDLLTTPPRLTAWKHACYARTALTRRA